MVRAEGLLIMLRGLLCSLAVPGKRRMILAVDPSIPVIQAPTMLRKLAGKLIIQFGSLER